MTEQLKLHLFIIILHRIFLRKLILLQLTDLSKGAVFNTILIMAAQINLPLTILTMVRATEAFSAPFLLTSSSQSLSNLLR